MADLTVGKKAPLFTLPSDGGQDISLSDYKGGKVILYFYPKDNTSGCTLEAQAFRANLEEFKKRGYSVLGGIPAEPLFRSLRSATSATSMNLISRSFPMKRKRCAICTAS